MFESIKQKIAETFANIPKPDITITVTHSSYSAQRRKRNQGPSLCHHSTLHCQRYLQKPSRILPRRQCPIHQKIRKPIQSRSFQCWSRRWWETPRWFRVDRSYSTIGGRLYFRAYQFRKQYWKASLLAFKCSLVGPKFGKFVWRLALSRTSPWIRILLRFIHR